MATIDDRATAFVDARYGNRPLEAFPGIFPATIGEAYAIQQAEIALWPDRIAGWKVGRLSPDLAAGAGVPRFVGPVFAATVQPHVAGEPAVFPAFRGGFAAFEAEYVIVLAADAPQEKTAWTPEEARAIAGPMHIGIEVAGSPLATINDLGSLASIAGFGNNAGQIIGAEVRDWRYLDPGEMPCAVSIDGAPVRAATAAALPGGPLAALAFALGQAAQLGLPLTAGTFVSTGAVTGIHPVRPGQYCRADFGVFGAIECRVELLDR